MTTVAQEQTNQETTTPTPKCPFCDAPLNVVPYIERGRKVWDGQTFWQEDEAYGDIEFVCPECDAELDCDFLEEIGLV